jgi:hypothetical protein
MLNIYERVECPLKSMHSSEVWKWSVVGLGWKKDRHRVHELKTVTKLKKGFKVWAYKIQGYIIVCE